MFVLFIDVLFLDSAIQLFYSVRNMFELYCNVVPTYHQQHLVSKVMDWSLPDLKIKHSWHFVDRLFDLKNIQERGYWQAQC